MIMVMILHQASSARWLSSSADDDDFSIQIPPAANFALRSYRTFWCDG
jgi:hypothetical protein